MSSHPQLRSSRRATSAAGRTTILVFSHLRWGFVFQRPQHVLTRLARHCDIVFVEEPVFDAQGPRLDVTDVSPGVEVITPRLPDATPGFSDAHLATLGRLLDESLSARRVRWPLVWFYTPMALPVLKYIAARGVVYDCMDDLASFRFAPPGLLAREGRLLDIADVVITGGPSLQAARRARRPDAHCLPSAVDVDHFASPGSPRDAEAIAAKAFHADIPGPRLGYMGVIDERIDLDLIDALAARRPEWSIVMVGPVVKIDPAGLPRRANIHWFGMAAYSMLPRLLSHWDVALMPFALNEATRSISPTKTLEYLAGGLPVVSTAVPDVLSLYGHVVHVAPGAVGFDGAIEELLKAPRPSEQADRARLSLLDASTWDAMVDRVLAAIWPWLGTTAASVPDRRLDAIGLEEPVGAAASRTRTSAH